MISVDFMELFESLSLQDEHQLFNERIRINELLIDWHTGDDDMSSSQCTSTSISISISTSLGLRPSLK